MFFVFAGANYYPDGGMDDYVGSYPDRAAADGVVADQLDTLHEWAQIAVLRGSDLVVICTRLRNSPYDNPNLEWEGPLA